MATEQASKAVDTGSRQVSETGESIQVLTKNMEEALQVSIQIAASSRQQLVGADQLASAMEDIKQVNMQNMESAKQLETLAQDLTELSQKLKEMVEKYRV